MKPYIQAIILTFLIPLTAYTQNPVENITVTITNEEQVNTDLLEYSPAFSDDGIVFISTKVVSKRFNKMDKKNKKNIMSIFKSVRDQATGQLKPGVPFAADITTPYHEGPLSFDSFGEKMYFTMNDSKQRKKAKLKIYESVHTDGDKWTKPVELSINADGYENAHPTVSSIGDIMIFASDRPDGYGGMDLYYTTKSGTTWSEPVNLGPGVNSSSNEVFPYLHPDGTLYFSSNGHSSTGGLDIFTSIQETPFQWSAPSNLGNEFNTSKDDFGFIVDLDKKNGYFSSNRPGGKGEDDIYAFSLEGGTLDEYLYFKKLIPPAVEKLDLYLLNEETQEPVQNGTATFLALNDPMIDPSMIGKDADGNLVIIPKTGDRDNIAYLDAVLAEKGRTVAANEFGEVSAKLPVGYYVAQLKGDGIATKMMILSTSSGQEVIQSSPSMNCIPVNTVLLNESNGETMADIPILLENTDGVTIMEVITDASGSASFCVPCAVDYNVSARFENQVIANQLLESSKIPCDDASVISLTLNANDIEVMLTEGVTIELKDIYYNLNDASLRPDMRTDVDNLAEILNQYPEMEIELSSYTDSRGTKAYNNRLSQQRANNVMNYLVDKGIDPSRIKAVGYGESRLRNECSDGVHCNSAQHAYNRRTEVTITKMGVPVMVKYNDAFPGSISKNSYNADGEYSGTVSSDANTSGSYWVIAGAFLVGNNAQKRVSQLIDMGYSNAFITAFNDTPNYKSVVVGQFMSKAEAQDFAHSFKATTGDNYYIKELK